LDQIGNLSLGEYESHRRKRVGQRPVGNIQVLRIDVIFGHKKAPLTQRGEIVKRRWV
jgi:hypothetical protein